MSKQLNLLRIYAQGKYTHLAPHWKQTILYIEHYLQHCASDICHH